MLKIEPKFSEAAQGASVNNCYIESGFTGKVQTRLRGRRDLVSVPMPCPLKWDETLAAYKSTKTGTIYYLVRTNYEIRLRSVKNGNNRIIGSLGNVYNMETICNFAEMRFLNNKYVSGFTEGNFGILFCAGGKLYLVDDLNPTAIKEIDEFGLDKINASVGSVAVVANRIIISELKGSSWWFSNPGGLETGDGTIFSTLKAYESEYSGDFIVRVARVAGIRLAVFGERTLEIWDVTDNLADENGHEDPFATSFQGQVYKIGCIAQSIEEINDVVYFCGIEDLSGRYSIYSIGRDGLNKLSENPLDTFLSDTIRTMGETLVKCGKYSENSVNFYLLHLKDFSLAYNLPEKSFSRFYHNVSVRQTMPFNCILMENDGIVIGFDGVLKVSDQTLEYTGYYTEKLLMLPVFDNGGAKRFAVNKLILDMSAITTPKSPPHDGNIIAIDYSTDGTKTFIGRRSIAIPEAGRHKEYPLRLFRLGRCNNMILRIYTITNNFILNSIIIEVEELL